MFGAVEAGDILSKKGGNSWLMLGAQLGALVGGITGAGWCSWQEPITCN